MKSFAAIVFGFVAAAVVSAQTPNLSDLPTCAITCATQALTTADNGDCGDNDYACICNDRSFISGISQCVEGACNEEEQQQILQFATTFCSGVGVTIPTDAIPSSTTPSATGSATTPVISTTGSPSGNGTGNGTIPSATPSIVPSPNSGSVLSVSGFVLSAAFAALVLL